MYICIGDLTKVTHATELAILVAQPSAVERAVAVACETVSGYLNYKYDVAAIFATQTYDYDIARAYQADEIIVDSDGDVYTCHTSGAAAGTALSNSGYFTKGDTRNSIVLGLVITITMYELSQTLATGQIAQLRITRYEEAIARLKEIRADRFNIALPLLLSPTQAQSTHTISVQANPKQSNFY